ncbi:MAG: aminotransferase class I/II-fold pyridoxal phosphate-dependent enzyme [Anaerovoracaceae bacterium]|jgi:cystathionine beta-lyase family protein involved in aluminum resistance
MQKNTFTLLTKYMGIKEEVLDIIIQAEQQVEPIFKELDDIKAYNQYKVLDAFQKCRISDTHFNWTTGYGYNDMGRDALEEVYAKVFRGEAALVRPIIVNGTHALTLTIAGILRPGDELIYCTGKPYDTLEEVIGIRGEGKGSLKEFGITYTQVNLTKEGTIDLEALKSAIGPNTRMITAQRATGYEYRKAITIEELKEWVSFVKTIKPDVITMVDNCYGEFLETREPTEVGVDVMAGSLIKNPGGGIALTGGYIVGRKDLIDNISYRMTSPGIGGECGLMFGQTRTMLLGLFIAPQTVNSAVKGAVLCAKVFENLGFQVCPRAEEPRSDIIETVILGSPERVVAFCEGIQSAAPVDSYVTPIPCEMPGYEDPVIMAAGAFIQGSSIELSADAPIRPPYAVYFQGGLTYEHSKFGVIKALQALQEQNLL